MPTPEESVDAGSEAAGSVLVASVVCPTKDPIGLLIPEMDMASS